MPDRREPRLDFGTLRWRLRALEQPVDVQPVAGVGRHAAGRRVRLPHQALFFEPRQDVADGGRRQPERAVLGQPRRRHRLALLDVLGDEPRQDPALAIRQVCVMKRS